MTDETSTPAEAPAEVVDEPKRIDPEPEAKVEEPKVPEVEDKGEDDDQSEDSPKKLSGAQRAKLQKERYLAELRERDQLLEEKDRRLKELEAKAEGKDGPPKEEDYNGDWTAWDDAKKLYFARQAQAEESAKREKAELTRRQADAKRERELAHAERVEEARETIADFDAVMATMKDVTIRNDVVDEIMASDKSPLLAYHLAKNPNKLRELESLTSRELAREIGRLEGSIRMPAGKKQTTAPPPPSNLKGGTAPATDLASADMEAYVAARKAQGYGKR